MRARNRLSVVAVAVAPVLLATAAAGDPRVPVRPIHTGSGRQVIVHCSRHNGSPQQCRPQQPLPQGVAAARPDLVQPAGAQAAQEERPPAEGTLRSGGYGARLHTCLNQFLRCTLAWSPFGGVAGRLCAAALVRAPFSRASRAHSAECHLLFCLSAMASASA